MDNRNQMNADQLLRNLSAQELEQILDLATLVTSSDWHKNKLVRVQELTEQKTQDKNVEFSIKERSGYIYLEIWMKEYKYWIQIDSGTKKFSLYLATNTEDEQILQKIGSLGFQYSSDWDGAHCYKNENRYKYPYLGEIENLKSSQMRLSTCFINQYFNEDFFLPLNVYFRIEKTC